VAWDVLFGYAVRRLRDLLSWIGGRTHGIWTSPIDGPFDSRQHCIARGIAEIQGHGFRGQFENKGTELDNHSTSFPR
jgi:hypothetical protein